MTYDNRERLSDEERHIPLGPGVFCTVEIADGVGLAPIFGLLGCRLVQMIRFDDSHALFLDEKGLRDGTWTEGMMNISSTEPI